MKSHEKLRASRKWSKITTWIHLLFSNMSNVQTCFEWVLLVHDIQPDTSHRCSSVGGVIGSEVTYRVAQRVNVGSYFLTSRRSRSLSLRAWVRATWASESWDSRVCICNSRIIGEVSFSDSKCCTLWQGTTHQVGGYQILTDSNRRNYKAIIQSCILKQISAWSILSGQQHYYYVKDRQLLFKYQE